VAPVSGSASPCLVERVHPLALVGEPSRKVLRDKAVGPRAAHESGLVEVGVEQRVEELVGDVEGDQTDAPVPTTMSELDVLAQRLEGGVVQPR
jgi:hypothetical protein